MSETQQDIVQLEREIADARELIEYRDRALRLAGNPDFRKIFLEDYFVTEAARLVQCSGDSRLSKEDREDALEAAKATGHTKRFLQTIKQMGDIAERSLGDKQEMLDHLRAVGDQE